MTYQLCFSRVYPTKCDVAHHQFRKSATLAILQPAKSNSFLRLPHTPNIQYLCQSNSSYIDPSGQEQPDDTDPDAGLTPEEDWVVPGTYQDAQSSKTELGKALRDAIEEVDALGNLEKDMLQQADELLKSMGYKRSLFDIEDGSTSNRSSSSSSSSSSGGGGGDRDGST